MSSWWGKDDKRDPRKGKDGGPKPLPIKLLRTSREKKNEHRVTQPTQRCRVRGVPWTWRETGQHSKQITNIVTQQYAAVTESLN